MAQSRPPAARIREDNLSPCYVFYGEETYFADKFVRDIREVLLGPEGEPLDLERFDLQETRWAEILDVARTAPFFFAPWRILVVTVREEPKKKPAAEEEKRDPKKKQQIDIERKMIREYCQSPAPKTVLIVVVSGKVGKGNPVLKHFESLPAGAVDLREMKPLKGKDLSDWLESTVRAAGRMVTPEARKKLLDIVGGDLRLLDNELQKLFTFAADKRLIDADDVAEVSDWGRTFQEWELVSGLERADSRQALLVLGRLFREGARPEYVLGSMASHFRDLLLARLWLRQGQDRKEIFRTLKPKIQEFWTDYQMLFRGFFEVAGDSKNDVLGWALGELERIDLLVKSSDVPAEAMISGFVVDYCRRRRAKPGRDATSARRG
jgi:DNA polymerase-3 subunit delta